MRLAIYCGALLLAACSDDPDFGGPGGSDPGADTALVFAERGARQCEYDGMTAEQSAQTLVDGGIDVLLSTCGYKTGVAFPAVCGGPTADILVHEIRTVNVPHAEALGYREAGTLVDDGQGTGYELVDCDERSPVPTP